MRHRKSFNHLSRKKGHRKAMLANMAASLIMHKRIKTTTAKAKALRMYVEPLITQSKNDSTHARRVVFNHIQSKEAVTELFREISPKIVDRPGGYTRILKTGFRLGDNSDMCIIELVDYNENLLTAKSEAAAKTGKRRRRGLRKKATEELQAASKPAGDIKEPSEKTESQPENIEVSEKINEVQEPEAEMKKENKEEVQEAEEMIKNEGKGEVKEEKNENEEQDIKDPDKIAQ